MPARALPGAADVLAIIARPGQESADLGAILHAFRRRGARLSLLCLTRGEASQLNSTCERLETIRPFELQVAAGLLGISSVTVADYPDGGLRLALVQELTERCGARSAGRHRTCCSSSTRHRRRPRGRPRGEGGMPCRRAGQPAGAGPLPFPPPAAAG